MSILIPLEFTQVLLAQTSSCHNIGQTELIVILALLGSLLTFAATASLPALTISIPTAVAKVLAGLAIGGSWTVITVPFEGLLDIAVVAAVVESINHLSGCG
jgi:hypothetical protein